MRIETRYFLCFIVATVLSVGAVVAWRWLPRPLPPEECSELYRAYMDTPGVGATFIRGFQVNDTVSVDVTLLQATDSAGWERLVNDTKLPNDTKEVHNDLTQKRTVLLRYTPKGYMTHHTDSVSLNNDLMAIDWTEQTIAIFHITDKKQSKSIIMYNIKKTKHA